MMTPLELKILIHYFISQDDYPNNITAVTDVLKRFADHGILEDNLLGEYTMTAKGEVYIREILTVAGQVKYPV